ncbi:hypothetical protein M011DRAFT_406705 [Sporormia fimetaria CBS 119925]|uniref:Apple domain-containing protein n=1 Tax=Sporormia fimetaria CBS 119925 TaxID=1340428 RepID=A0A6A6V5Z0_9PLEO|nr:hypothetical protein M011DRAFT_406705 [Sporormia fimetaria CBS 119925]
MYDPPEDKKARICGIKRKTFFIILAIAIGVIIGAGIGGGVAAAMSKKDASPQQANLDPLNTGASRSSSSSKSATPTTIGPSFKTIEVVSPTKTLYRDCPDSDNTIKEITLDDNTPTMRFRKKCRTDFDKPKGRTKGFVVNTKLLNLDDCINQCAMWNRNNREDIMNGLKDKCNVVCWRSTFESDWPAQCFGWQSVNSTNSNNEWDFSSYDSSQCDGAGWIDEWEI